MSVPQPSLIVFDVNETLSDLSLMQQRFEDVGLSGHDAAAWFSTVLRDGFALTVTGDNPSFASLARGALEVALSGRVPEAGLEESVSHILDGFSALRVHGDVIDGVTALHHQGRRLVTLSNGAATVAATLLSGAGIEDRFERLLSVADAPGWKPAGEAYRYGLATCGVEDPGEAMLVAVHPWDVDGAHRAGLSTAWLNRAESRYPAYFARPDLEVTSLTDLAERLRR